MFLVLKILKDREGKKDTVAESLDVNRDQTKGRDLLTRHLLLAHRGRRLSIRLSSAGVLCIAEYPPTATKQFS